MNPQEPVRLSKRLIEQLGCSRREAELYIEGGWVTVDGIVGAVGMADDGEGTHQRPRRLGAQHRGGERVPFEVVVHARVEVELPQLRRQDGTIVDAQSVQEKLDEENFVLKSHIRSSLELSH